MFSLPCRETDQLDGNVNQLSTGQREAVVSAARKMYYPQNYQELKAFVGSISSSLWWSHIFFFCIQWCMCSDRNTILKFFNLHLNFELCKIKSNLGLCEYENIFKMFGPRID